MEVNCYTKTTVLNALYRSGGKLLVRPDPSLSTEQKMSALGILNLSQQFTYSNFAFMFKILHNLSSDYLAQVLLVAVPLH